MIERGPRNLGLREWVVLTVAYSCAASCMLPESGGSAIVQAEVELTTGGASSVSTEVAVGEAVTASGGASALNAAGGNGSGGTDCNSASCVTDAGTQVKPQFCGGACRVPDDFPPNGVIRVPQRSVFAFRQTLINPAATVVALGVVTNIAADVNLGQQGHFKLGLYREVGNMPAELLAQTEELTAQDSSCPTEGKLSRSVTLADYPSESYWIIMVVTGPYDVYVEKYDRALVEDVLFAAPFDCLPLSTPECVMPALTTYGDSYVTLSSRFVEPFMFAKYVFM